MKRQDRLTVPVTIDWPGDPPGKNNRKHFLRHLIKINGFTTMTEVGVRDGRTTFFLLDHCPDLVITAIDSNISQFYSSEIHNRYGDRLKPIQGHSHQVAKQIADSSQDLVFIDADHSYRGASGDILAYRSKLRPGGLLTGHDIDYPGVNQAVKELIKNYDVGPNFVWIAK